jgi:hypothetical protein
MSRNTIIALIYRHHTFRLLLVLPSSLWSRKADHVTPYICKKLALTSPTSGSRLVGIVRLRTQATGFVRLFVISIFPVWKTNSNKCKCCFVLIQRYSDILLNIIAECPFCKWIKSLIILKDVPSFEIPDSHDGYSLGWKTWSTGLILRQGEHFSSQNLFRSRVYLTVTDYLCIQSWMPFLTNSLGSWFLLVKVQHT